MAIRTRIPMSVMPQMFSHELTVIAGGKEEVAKAGDTVFIAPNENREIVNRGNGVCTLLVAVAAPK